MVLLSVAVLRRGHGAGAAPPAARLRDGALSVGARDACRAVLAAPGSGGAE